MEQMSIQRRKVSFKHQGIKPSDTRRMRQRFYGRHIDCGLFGDYHGIRKRRGNPVGKPV